MYCTGTYGLCTLRESQSDTATRKLRPGKFIFLLLGRNPIYIVTHFRSHTTRPPYSYHYAGGVATGIERAVLSWAKVSCD